MKLYYSGNVEEETNKYMLDHYNVCRLATFAYPKEASSYLTLADECEKSVDMIVDSGAFSAWSVGHNVLLEDLINYSKGLLEEYGSRHSLSFIALDVMPGKKGFPPTEEELIKSVNTSKENYHIQQKALGDHIVMPVYHSGEPIALRDYYLEYTDHIALSMNQQMPEKHRVAWASRVQVDGVKLHGLAATGSEMVRRVNWFSVDSASWIMVSAMGGIIVDYTGVLGVLAVSAESPNVKVRGNHLLNRPDRQYIEDYIRGLGFDPDELVNYYPRRRQWNVMIWQKHNWGFAPQQEMGFFSD